MRSRESGFTLIEIMIVMAIIVTLAGMVMVVIPIAQERNKRTTCANHLRQIGTVLVAEHTEKRWPRDPGAGFILRMYFSNKQIRGDVKIFVCPGDGNVAYDGGSEEHKELFKGLNKKLEDWDDNITSYCGRNVRDYPISPDSEENEPLACDRTGGTVPHHSDGLNILFRDGKVEFQDKDKLGLNPEDEILVGPGGPKVLEPLAFKVH